MQINGYRLPNIYLFSSRNNTKIKKISFIHNWVSHYEYIYIYNIKQKRKSNIIIKSKNTLFFAWFIFDISWERKLILLFSFFLKRRRRVYYRKYAYLRCVFALTIVNQILVTCMLFLFLFSNVDRLHMFSLIVKFMSISL